MACMAYGLHSACKRALAAVLEAYKRLCHALGDGKLSFMARFVLLCLAAYALGNSG